MILTYLPFCETRFHEDLGFYTSYGIRAVDSKGEVLLSVSDVSGDEKAVSALCERCTRGKLALIHLMDVIEDEFL